MTDESKPDIHRQEQPSGLTSTPGTAETGQPPEEEVAPLLDVPERDLFHDADARRTRWIHHAFLRTAQLVVTLALLASVALAVQARDRSELFAALGVLVSGLGSALCLGFTVAYLVGVLLMPRGSALETGEEVLEEKLRRQGLFPSEVTDPEEVAERPGAEDSPSRDVVGDQGAPPETGSFKAEE